MTISLGITLNCVIIYEDDEDFNEQTQFCETTFYQISTVYKAIHEIYGKGTMIVSGGLEYFTTIPGFKVNALIRDCKIKETEDNLRLFIN